MSFIINILFSKKGFYLLGFIAFVIAILIFRSYFISVGIAECQAKIQEAVIKETTRIEKINKETFKDAANRIDKLQLQNDELSEQLQNSEQANNIEPDVDCLSSSRLQRINAIRD